MPQGVRRRSALPPALRATLLVTMMAAAPAEGQLADAFASHFGASRTFEPGVTWSIGAGVMLLTQYGSRWVPDDTVYWQYDQLQTTVGYNYGQAGLSRSWPFALLGGTPVVSLNVTGGETADRYTQQAQDGLHDFRRFPHVQRGTVDDGISFVGADVEALLWWSFPVWIFRVDAHPRVAVSWSGVHRETSVRLGAGTTFWKARLQGSVGKGWILGRGGIEPAAVASRLKGSYGSWTVSLALDRTRYGAMATYLPAVGFAVSGSSGIFVNEDETFLSLFFEFPSFVPNHSFRLETVNDLIAGKDRGPTGGLRLTYVAR